MQKYLFFGLFVLAFSAFSQQRMVLSGFVKDSVSGEALTGAYIYNPNGGQEGAISNGYGFFSFTTVDSQQSYTVSYAGYVSQKLPIQKLVGQNNAVIFLSPITEEEVRISAEAENKAVSNNEMSKVRLNINTIRRVPVILGETDVLKTLTLLPGIKQVGEGSAGFYVRGGGPDQNLVLLDEAVLYNPSHLLGLFSVFNGDAVKDVEVLKGAMPANYGGRLSSIVNVSMKEGNNQKWKASAGIGLLTSRLTIEGPIQKGKSSFLISGRGLYLFNLLTAMIPKRVGIGVKYSFYDLNAKMNFQLSNKDQLYVSGYFGDDVFRFQSKTGIGIGIEWGNRVGTLRWNHIYNQKLFSNTTFAYNRYRINYDSKLGLNTLGILSMLKDYNLKHEYQYFVNNKWALRFGGNMMYRVFQAGIASANQTGTNLTTKIPLDYATEGAAFVHSEHNFTDKFSLNLGLRYSLFNLMGPYTQVFYDNLGQPTGETKTYQKGESIAFYQGLEPRAFLKYQFSEQSSLKASYNRVFQYVHLATSSAATLPTDFWIPSSIKVKPEVADQFTLGYFHNLKNNAYELSAEAYYKTMQNQVEVLPGTNLIFNQHIEDYLVFGKGTSYGIELLAKKNVGKTTGWIGYTWSKTDRVFADLNNGKPFPYRYDRRHDLSIVVMHRLNEKWDFSANFVYYTGNAITLPTGRFTFFNGVNPADQQTIFSVIDQYTVLNGSRMPAHHRLDVSANYTPKPKKARKYQSQWNFSIYNAYSRQNPYFVYMYADKALIPNQIDNNTVSARQVSLFPILPSVTWNVKL
ncbi:MAG: TonB-dependent receptor domain-containing protein [Bacteroidia bacterium]